MEKGETKKFAHCKDQSVFVSVLIIVGVADAVAYLNLYVYDFLYFYSTITICEVFLLPIKTQMSLILFIMTLV